MIYELDNLALSLWSSFKRVHLSFHLEYSLEDLFHSLEWIQNYEDKIFTWSQTLNLRRCQRVESGAHLRSSIGTVNQSWKGLKIYRRTLQPNPFIKLKLNKLKIIIIIITRVFHFVFEEEFNFKLWKIFINFLIQLDILIIFIISFKILMYLWINSTIMEKCSK